MLSGETKNNLKTGAPFWQPLILLVLVMAGIILYYLDVFDWSQVFIFTRNWAQYWWIAVVVIVVQIILYTFALPGSLLLWIVAPIYGPLTSTTILVTGSTLGALSAYWFAHSATVDWVTRIRHSRFFSLLDERGDFLTLSALRILPSFPHSVINYGAGILRLPLGRFVGSSIIGFTLKNYLYTSVVYGAVAASDPSEILNVKTLWPLILLALLFAVAAFVRNRWFRIHKQN